MGIRIIFRLVSTENIYSGRKKRLQDRKKLQPEGYLTYVSTYKNSLSEWI